MTLRPESQLGWLMLEWLGALALPTAARDFVREVAAGPPRHGKFDRAVTVSDTPFDTPTLEGWPPGEPPPRIVFDEHVIVTDDVARQILAEGGTFVTTVDPATLTASTERLSDETLDALERSGNVVVNTQPPER
jgi:hypothetical protein